MCKYCELKRVGGIEGELENKNRNSAISSIDDGRHLIELYMNRYIIESDDINESYLLMEYMVKDFENDIHTIDYAKIAIKYCPFCGEKL